MDNVLSFSLKCTGGAKNFYLKFVTVHIFDPPPTVNEILDQEVGSANTLTVSGITVSSFTGDNIQVTASATCGGANVDPTSYSISLGANGLYALTFTPADAGINSGVVSFTVTAVGAGGPASESFDCTVTTGVVKTKPTIDPIPNQTVHTLHPLYVPFVVREADEGDWVITNAPTVVSSTIPEGRFGYDSNGSFFFTPETADAALSSVVFSITATDPEGDSDPATISVEILPGTPPSMNPIARQTVAYGSTNFVAIAISKTEDDPITATNLTVKAGTDAPTGDFAVEDGKAWFAPAVADIGNTFSFTLAAEDMHGLSSISYDVSVILAKPVLKHCPVEDWTPTSFTADIEEAVPGATSYNLRYIHHEDDGTPVTNTIPVTSLHYVVSGLATTNYVYDVQAIRGAVTSVWSNAKSIDLHAWVPYEPAIRMTKDGGGVYTQEFDTLIKSGTGKWYDGRTLPGWHTCWYGRTITDTTVNYEAFKYNDDNSHQGFFSFEIDRENPGNRAFGMRNDTQNAYAQIGIAFTNECRYAVTNVFISFTAAQFRDATGESWLRVQYAKTDAVRSLHQGDWPEGQVWKDASALDFRAPKQTKAQEMEPDSERRSGNIALTGNDAIQPGEVLLIQWWMDEPKNGAPLGIDHLRIEWRCAWPCHTVIMLQ